MTHKSDFTDEQLSAFLDSELPQEDMTAIENALETDPVLLERLETLQSANRAWGDALSTIDNSEVSQNVLDMLQDTESIAVNDNNPSLIKRWAMTGVAASLAFVIGLSFQSAIKTETNLNSPYLLAGSITSEHPLYNVLETAPSAIAVKIGDKLNVKPVLTFQTRGGDFCREYVVTSDISATRNVACRNDDSWNLQITTPTQQKTHDDYHVVSGNSDQAVDQLIDTIIQDIPLGKDAEAALITSDWKKPP